MTIFDLGRFPVTWILLVTCLAAVENTEIKAWCKDGEAILVTIISFGFLVGCVDRLVKLQE